MARPIVDVLKYRYYTYEETAESHCSICGKYLKKTFSDTYREDFRPHKEEVHEKVLEWESKKYICDACKMAMYETDKYPEIPAINVDKIKRLKLIQSQIEQLRAEKERIAREFAPTIVGNVLKYNGKEYKILEVTGGAEKNLPFEIKCIEINKRKSWKVKTSGPFTYFSSKKTKSHANIDDSIITVEKFSEREIKMQEQLSKVLN